MKNENAADETEHGPQALFDRDNKQEDAASPAEAGTSKWWKVIVALGLVVVVGLVLAAKRGPRESEVSVQPRDSVGGRTPEPAKKVFPPATVVTAVNGEEVTLADLEKAIKELPTQYRAEYERRKHEFLDELIAKKLLLQEARTRKIAETEAYRKAFGEHKAHPGHEEHVLVDVLLGSEVLAKVKVTDADMRAFYKKYKDQLPGRPSFEKAAEMIGPSVKQQKQYEAIAAYVERLKKKARIVRNEEWLEVQKKAAAGNPLDRALAGGRPVLADFGRGTCIPCKMMKPILDKMAEELKGKVHVLILDTGDYAQLARRHRVRVIPTQIFFDGAGKELSRHEGFMSREDMLAKMKEHGMTGK